MFELKVTFSPSIITIIVLVREPRRGVGNNEGNYTAITPTEPHLPTPVVQRSEVIKNIN